jgi:hypothetical protein
MTKVVLRAISICAATVGLLALAGPAMAHETRTEGGVEAVVGWANEPAYVGFPNAVQLTLSDSGRAIADLGADELKVEVTFGDQKTAPLPIEPAFQVGSFGNPGEYHANLIPTRAGNYSFHFFGTIKGSAYDQTFTSGEQTFDAPRNPADVSFPAKDPTAGELAASIERLSSEDRSGGASDNPDRIALGLAAAALAVALAALAKSRRAA